MKALSGILVINAALLLSIGMWLLVNRPADEKEANPAPPPPAPVPEEVPPLPAPEEVSGEQK